MSDNRWIRVGACVGIAFVAISIIAGAITGSPPAPNDADQVFKDFFVDKHDQLLLQAWLYALATPLLLWFACAVRRVLRQAEGDQSYFGDLFLVSVTATAVLVIVAMAMQIAVIRFSERLDAEVVRAVGLNFGAAAIALFGFLVAAAAMSFAVVVFTSGVYPRWTAWLAVIALAVNLLGAVGVFFSDGPLSIEGGFTVFLPAASTVIWYLGTSVAMLRMQTIVPMGDPEPAL